jgi:hypothetical protein
MQKKGSGIGFDTGAVRRCGAGPPRRFVSF